MELKIFKLKTEPKLAPIRIVPQIAQGLRDLAVQDVREAQRPSEEDAGREPDWLAGRVQGEEQRAGVHHRLQGGEGRGQGGW